MLIRVPVTVYDEYIDDRPDYAEIVLSEERIEWIRRIAAEVKRLDVYKVEDFDYSADFFEEDYNAEETTSERVFRPCQDFRTDCASINVTKDGVHWSGYVKHCDIKWETDTTRLDDLDKELVDQFTNQDI